MVDEVNGQNFSIQKSRTHSRARRQAERLQRKVMDVSIFKQDGKLSNLEKNVLKAELGLTDEQIAKTNAEF